MLDLAGVYVPATPMERVNMFGGLGRRLSTDTIVGGDWNCVPDVTLDVKSKDPLSYPNVGATLLASEMSDLGLYDIRREQLESAHEFTRQSDSSNMCTTRLDRWYVPTGEGFDGTLWNVTVEDSLVWKDSPSDHLPVTLQIEGKEGEQGHERHNIRGDLLARPEVQRLVIETVEKAYGIGGNVEERWTRAHNMMRSVLLAETAKERKVNKPAILEARGHLEIIRRKVVKHGLSPALQGQREKKQKELLRLERPEIKPNDPETAKRMADQSDKCTSSGAWV